MWGGWVDALASRLEAATGAGAARAACIALLGVDPATGLRPRPRPPGRHADVPHPRGRRGVRRDAAGAGPAAAAAAVAGAWHAPDPVALAQPVTDLARAARPAPPPRRGPSPSRPATTAGPPSGRWPALGIADEFAALACADDGIRTSRRPTPCCTCARGSACRRSEPRSSATRRPTCAWAARRARHASIAVLTGVGDRASLEPLADVVLASIAELAPA